MSWLKVILILSKMNHKNNYNILDVNRLSILFCEKDDCDGET
jgi:hypothetical protein